MNHYKRDRYNRVSDTRYGLWALEWECQRSKIACLKNNCNRRKYQRNFQNCGRDSLLKWSAKQINNG